MKRSLRQRLAGAVDNEVGGVRDGGVKGEALGGEGEGGGGAARRLLGVRVEPRELRQQIGEVGAHRQVVHMRREHRGRPVPVVALLDEQWAAREGEELEAAAPAHAAQVD